MPPPSLSTTTIVRSMPRACDADQRGRVVEEGDVAEQHAPSAAPVASATPTAVDDRAVDAVGAAVGVHAHVVARARVPLEVADRHRRRDHERASRRQRGQHRAGDVRLGGPVVRRQQSRDRSLRELVGHAPLRRATSARRSPRQDQRAPVGSTVEARWPGSRHAARARSCSARRTRRATRSRLATRAAARRARTTSGRSCVGASPRGAGTRRRASSTLGRRARCRGRRAPASRSAAERRGRRAARRRRRAPARRRTGRRRRALAAAGDAVVQGAPRRRPAGSGPGRADQRFAEREVQVHRARRAAGGVERRPRAASERHVCTHRRRRPRPGRRTSAPPGRRGGPGRSSAARRRRAARADGRRCTRAAAPAVVGLDHGRRAAASPRCRSWSARPRARPVAAPMPRAAKPADALVVEHVHATGRLVSASASASGVDRDPGATTAWRRRPAPTRRRGWRERRLRGHGQRPPWPTAWLRASRERQRADRRRGRRSWAARSCSCTGSPRPQLLGAASPASSRVDHEVVRVDAPGPRRVVARSQADLRPARRSSPSGAADATYVGYSMGARFVPPRRARPARRGRAASCSSAPRPASTTPTSARRTRARRRRARRPPRARRRRRRSSTRGWRSRSSPASPTRRSAGRAPARTPPTAWPPASASPAPARRSRCGTASPSSTMPVLWSPAATTPSSLPRRERLAAAIGANATMRRRRARATPPTSSSPRRSSRPRAVAGRARALARAQTGDGEAGGKEHAEDQLHPPGGRPSTGISAGPVAP